MDNQRMIKWGLEVANQQYKGRITELTEAMVQNCIDCGIEYDSEGHELIDWLTQCLPCNEKRRAKQNGN